MSDVFVSYAQEDRYTAKELAEALRERGFDVWWDDRLIAGGAFHQDIERELDAARAVIVIWSRHSVDSPWVGAEASLAAEQGKLVPVALSDGAYAVRPPLPFRMFQTVEVDELDGAWGKQAMEVISAAVRHRMAAGLTDAPRLTHRKPFTRAVAQVVPGRRRARTRNALAVVIVALVASIGVIAVATRDVLADPCSQARVPLRPTAARTGVSGRWVGHWEGADTGDCWSTQVYIERLDTGEARATFFWRVERSAHDSGKRVVEIARGTCATPISCVFPGGWEESMKLDPDSILDELERYELSLDETSGALVGQSIGEDRRVEGELTLWPDGPGDED